MGFIISTPSFFPYKIGNLCYLPTSFEEMLKFKFIFTIFNLQILCAYLNFAMSKLYILLLYKQYKYTFILYLLNMDTSLCQNHLNVHCMNINYTSIYILHLLSSDLLKCHENQIYLYNFISNQNLIYM